MDSAKHPLLESIGKRIARLRSERGLTQQALAARMAVSRVAISHIEMDLTIPSERTITLLAGIFKVTPHALVEMTTYPQAKAEKLPASTCCFTSFEVELIRLENDLDWLRRLEGSPEWARFARDVHHKWHARLCELAEEDLEPLEREMASVAAGRLAEAIQMITTRGHLPS